MIDLAHDYFTLFGVEPGFRLDMVRLERAYLDLQARVHPDRHAHLPQAQQRQALQWATRVNEAWRTLRQPLSRALYLLERAGVAVGLETNTAMSPEFLIEQMEWREAVEEAREGGDGQALEHLHQRLRAQARTMNDLLARQIDDERDLAAAAESVRRLKFIEKLETDIEEALEALEH